MGPGERRSWVTGKCSGGVAVISLAARNHRQCGQNSAMRRTSACSNLILLMTLGSSLIRGKVFSSPFGQ